MPVGVSDASWAKAIFGVNVKRHRLVRHLLGPGTFFSKDYKTTARCLTLSIWIVPA